MSFPRTILHWPSLPHRNVDYVVKIEWPSAIQDREMLHKDLNTFGPMVKWSTGLFRFLTHRLFAAGNRLCIQADSNHDKLSAFGPMSYATGSLFSFLEYYPVLNK